MKNDRRTPAVLIVTVVTRIPLFKKGSVYLRPDAFTPAEAEH